MRLVFVAAGIFVGLRLVRLFNVFISNSDKPSDIPSDGPSRREPRGAELFRAIEEGRHVPTPSDRRAYEDWVRLKSEVGEEPA